MRHTITRELPTVGCKTSCISLKGTIPRAVDIVPSQRGKLSVGRELSTRAIGRGRLMIGSNGIISFCLAYNSSRPMYELRTGRLSNSVTFALVDRRLSKYRKHEASITKLARIKTRAQRVITSQSLESLRSMNR